MNTVVVTIKPSFDANNNEPDCYLTEDENRNVVATWKPVGSAQSPKKSPHKKYQHEDKECNDFMYFSADRLTATDLMKSGGRASVTVNNKEIAIICHENVVYAVQEKCPHIGGPLHLGDIEDIPGSGPCIKCPWHKWTFSLTTGKCHAPKDREQTGNIETFPVRMDVKRNEIKIGFTEIAPTYFSLPPC